MRSREGQIVEERLAGVILGMFLEAFDRVIGNRIGGIVTGILLHLGQLLVILPVNLRIKKPSLVLQVVGAVEAITQRHAVDVPLARVVCAVASRFQHGGQ